MRQIARELRFAETARVSIDTEEETKRSALAEIAKLLNEGESWEALKELRRMHGLVNRFVCETCGHVCARVTGFRCPQCAGIVNTRVVIETPNGALG